MGVNYTTPDFPLVIDNWSKFSEEDIKERIKSKYTFGESVGELFTSSIYENNDNFKLLKKIKISQ